MARKLVELTIHEPGRKTEVDEGELANLRGQNLIRTEGDRELVEDVPGNAVPKPAPATGSPPAPAVKTKPAPAEDGS